MKTNMNTLNPTSYTGVGADNPPNLTVQKRDPTNDDYRNFSINTLWWSKGLGKLWMLADNKPSSTSKWIQLYPVGTGGASEFVSDSGSALSYNDVMQIVGDNNTQTSASGNTVTVGLKDVITIPTSLTINALGEGFVVSDSSGLLSSVALAGTDLQLFTGRTGSTPVFLTPVSEDNSVTIAAGSVPGTINFESAGGGGGNFAGLKDSAGTTATPSAGKVTVSGIEDTYGHTNIISVADSHTIGLKLNDFIGLPATDFTDPMAPKGCLAIGGRLTLHTRGTQNIFIGQNVAISGDFNVISAKKNIGIGYQSLADLETSKENVAIGENSLTSLISGSGRNVAIGREAAKGLKNGEYNCILGDGAASNFSGSESYNLVIDNPATAGMDYQVFIGDDDYHTDCHIAGIYDSSNLSATNGVVLIDENAKLISSKGTTGQVLTAGASGVTWQDIPAPSSSQNSYAFCIQFPDYYLPDANQVVLGEDHILTTTFSDASCFYPGGGVAGDPATFTAQKAGYYWFVAKDYTKGYITGWVLTLNKVDNKYWLMETLDDTYRIHKYFVYMAQGEVLKFNYKLNPVSSPPYRGAVIMYCYYLGA